MSNRDNGSAISGLVILVFYALVIFGWGNNIYKFAQCDFESNMKEEIIRGIGIPVFPVGVVVGYMNF